jgi:hypothetical protein
VNNTDEVMARCLDCGCEAKVGLTEIVIVDPPSRCEIGEGLGCPKFRAAISAARRLQLSKPLAPSARDAGPEGA